MAVQCDVRCSILVVRKHAALLVHRTRDGLDDWVLPGGTPCAGEGLAACAQRELLEETGVSAVPSRVALVVESASPGARPTLDIVFVADGAVLSREHGREPGMAPCFVSADQLPGLVLHPPVASQLIRLLDPGPQQQHAAYVRNRTTDMTSHESSRREPAVSEALARTRTPRWAGSWLTAVNVPTGRDCEHDRRELAAPQRASQRPVVLGPGSHLHSRAGRRRQLVQVRGRFHAASSTSSAGETGAKQWRRSM